MSSSSFFDVRWRVTSWLPNSFVQVTLASFHEFLGTPQNCREKMIFRGHFPSELNCRKAGDVDLSSKTAFSFPNRRCKFGLTDSTDHQQVDVASRMFLTACHGTINKSAVDPILKWLQRLLEGRKQPGGLFEEAAQLGKQRRLCFCFEVDPRSFAPLLQNPAVDKRFEFPLEARRGGL